MISRPKWLYIALVIMLLLLNSSAKSLTITPDRYEIMVGDLRLISEAPLTAQDYSYAQNTLTITGRTALTLSGTTEMDRVVVRSGATAAITLDNIQIDTSITQQACALDVGDAFVSLRLQGENRLSSAMDKAGLRVIHGGSLTVAGTGSLHATGGNGGAGIGGNRNEASGDILVQGGSLRVLGGDFAAGIGGGDGGACGEVAITGGVVDVTGGNSGAGIGSGWNANGGTVTISGGTVIAKGGYTGAGIGGGWNGSAGNITICGGIVEAIAGQDGVGIGHGRDGSGGTFSTGENGTAFLSASQIVDRTQMAHWSGIIFEGNNGLLYNNQIIRFDVTIAKGKTLTIAREQTLDIASAATLTNLGTIRVEAGGVLTNMGTVINKGVMINHGAVYNDNTIVGVVGGTPPVWPEQFTEGVTLGATYYFDLSAVRDLIGRVNEGGAAYDGFYVGVPDATLRYVPFTYAGTVLADSYANSGLRSLFFCDYVIGHAFSWDQLHENNLIYGRQYQSAGIPYLLRAPSGGKEEQNGRGLPIQNEWDRILDKGGSMGSDAKWIQNWHNIFTWCQERCT